MSSNDETHEDPQKELMDLEKRLVDELDQNADAGPSGDVPPGDNPAEQQQEDPKPEPEAEAPKAETHPEPEKPQGDLRQALRASRHAEKRARDEAARLAAEVEALRAKVPQEESGETERAAIEADLPEVATVFRRMEERLARVEGAVQAPAKQDEPEFVAETLPPEVQALVDDIPALLGMQNDPNQERWLAAKRMDAFLVTHPKWKDAPETDRLQEVARRIAEDFAPAKKPQAADPKAKAQERIARATGAAEPETLSGLRGGQQPGQSSPDYSRMSDDEVIASL